MPLPAAMPRLGGGSRALRLATTPTATATTIARLPLALLVAATTLRRWRNRCRMDRLEARQRLLVDFALDQFFDVAQVEPFVGTDQ